MIERLIASLRLLAAPADVQLAHRADFAVHARELALDYADAVRLAVDCQQVRLASAERAALERLDEQLDRIVGDASAEPWTEGAVRTSREWEQVRALAHDALAALGVPGALPPPAAST